MFINANDLVSGGEVETDICIIGAGAAGISIAAQFLAGPLRVAILEGGGLELEPSSQDIYAAEAGRGIPYPALDEVRFRYFGGSTGVEGWGGWCKPFDAFDFEPRPGIEWSGWPISREDLDPYYEAAHSVLGLGPFEYSVDAWDRELETGLGLPKLGTGRVETELCQLGPPTRFGQEYRERFANNGFVSVYLNGSAVQLEMDAAGDRVVAVQVRTLGGASFRVRAKQFVVAAGGIENARILLASDVGNTHDLVGRFFMDNPMVWAGEIILTEPGRWTELFDPHGKMRKRNRNSNGTFDRSLVAAGIRLDPEVHQSEVLLNYRAWLSPFFSGDQTPAMDSARRLYWDLIKNRTIPRNLSTHLWRVIRGLPDVVQALFSRVAKRRSKNRRYLLVNVLEQDPNPDSRIMLGSTKDALGVRRVILDWQMGPAVRRTLRRAHEIIAEELQVAGVGTLEKPFTGPDEDGWKTPPMTTWHHIGTTRMAADPHRGVVDADCKVHGVSNLYVAGSSVFPTAGNDMPTLTIVALALRLAEHLKGLQDSPSP